LPVLPYNQHLLSYSQLVPVIENKQVRGTREPSEAIHDTTCGARLAIERAKKRLDE
jgi:hypothetical protein